jgi:hypothetical protein
MSGILVAEDIDVSVVESSDMDIVVAIVVDV